MQNNEMLQQSNQMLTLYNDLQETNKQFILLNEQLLKDKERAEERDRMKTAFLANMVHEISTPMNAIRGFAELLQTPDVTEEEKDKYAQMICQCTDSLLNLVHDLLDVSKIEAGQLTIIERPGNLKDLFNELFELFNTTGQFGARTVQLKSSIELTQAQYMIDADFTRLRQILINLISNALKFTEKGHVHYGCRLINRKTLCFYVEDTGIGIPPEKQAIIFERFKQINDTSLTKIYKGTGLGLSIVKSLAELMNGNVWVESVQGAGSTFYFTLPYKKSTTKKPVTQNNIAYNWSNKNLLIVKNDDFDIFLMDKYLNGSKVNCIYAKDGKSALKLIKSDPSINLTLLNIQLPDTNGFDLAREIKKIAPHMPIIAQTALCTQKDKELALKCGCNIYIPASINKEKLLQLIQEQFATRKNSLIDNVQRA
jgi:signal transduction histidine kinase/ActR/RegA family two-component response regulator